MLEIKLEYWWIILPGALLFAWVLSKFSKTKRQAPTVQEMRNSNSYSPQVQFLPKGRYGSVRYTSPEGSFDLYFEFEGGGLLATIWVPSESNWLTQTGIALQRREEVLHFIGKSVVERQTMGGSYKLNKEWILIYS